jgi:hypothetical protein
LHVPQAHRFEAAGLERKQAEELAMHITELIVVNKAKMEDTFVGKAVHEKVCKRRLACTVQQANAQHHATWARS